MTENSDTSWQRPEQYNHWLMALAVLFLIYYFVKIGLVTQSDRISYSDFINKVEQQQDLRCNCPGSGCAQQLYWFWRLCS